MKPLVIETRGWVSAGMSNPIREARITLAGPVPGGYGGGMLLSVEVQGGPGVHALVLPQDLANMLDQLTGARAQA